MLLPLRMATGYRQLSRIFGISAAEIARAAYGSRSSYVSFNISKRSGGARLIEAPVGTIRLLQSLLAQCFVAEYVPPDCAHGFIRGKSIVSNCAPHVGKRLVVNIDLKDFFHSITFKRVRGLLLGRPFLFGWQVSNILAQVCCYKGRLPAGGLTSPVISNMVLARLDKRFASLASRHGGTYSRYADDLTLSFDRPLYQIPGVATRGPDGVVSIGPQALQIILDEGFQPNADKVRVSEGGARKLVTGIVLNKRLNVRRDWLRSLESTIYAVEKFGASSVAVGTFPDLAPDVAERVLLRKVHGQLSYLFMVRGRGDWIAADLANRFNLAHSNGRLRVPDVEIINQRHRAPRCLALVTACISKGYDPGEWDAQGTGFVCDRGLILTADHVLRDEKKNLLPNVFVSRERSPAAVKECEIIYSDAHLDVAVLRLIDHESDVVRHRVTLSDTCKIGDRVMSLGFPSYSLGHPSSVQEHEVTLCRVVSGVKRFVVSGTIQGGLSGGPVFDSRFNVVGMVHRGLANAGHANEVIASSVLQGVLAKV